MDNNKKESVFLNIESARQMIRRLLLEKKMTKGQLAEYLNVNVKKLDKIFYNDAMLLQLLSKINLPLIELYCNTKWD